MTTETATQTGRPISRSRLWFGFAGGALAWTLHGFFSVVLTAQACEDGSGGWGPLSAGTVRLLLALMNLCFLALAGLGGLTSFRNWRRLSRDHDIAHAEASGREQFMALTGIFVGTIFFIGICWGALPLMILDICNKGR